MATFGDALRRLTDDATYLYQDSRRYWYSTQPSVARMAQDRAGQQDPESVAEAIRKRVRDATRTAPQRGDFARVHPCPTSLTEVPDEREARLVILGPEHPHVAKAGDSAARTAVVFLAPDRTRLAELEQAVRLYLAWHSIEAEADDHNLDAFQRNLARTKREQADETVKQRIPETYTWLLVPFQDDPLAGIEWQEIRTTGDDPLAVRASRKLRGEELLVTQLGGARLRLTLDRIPLWRGDHVPVRQLWDDFAQYLYLPRLKDSSVLVGAIQSGVALLTWETETFASAEGWDEGRGRYLGLVAGSGVSVGLDSSAVVVKPEAARRQLDADLSAGQAKRAAGGITYPPTGEGQLGNGQIGDGPPSSGGTVAPPAPAKLRRFHGSVRLDPVRPSRDMGTIAENIIQHLSGLVGAEVAITVEISADIPDGTPDHIVRTVTENCRTLRFTSSGFEEV